MHAKRRKGDLMKYELWQKVETLGDSEIPLATNYRWMVWEVGPITGGEEWFDTEEEARAYIAAKLEAVAAA